jgi:hypothetical protein
MKINKITSTTTLLTIIIIQFFSFSLSTITKQQNQIEQEQPKILPFSSIKIINNDQIHVTLDLQIKDWHKLLSIDNIGSDAIIKFAKEHFGYEKCDYEIECYKYNIIANFEKVYNLILNTKEMPKRISLEYEFENKKQNGMDVESTKEKYIINQNNIEKNIKESKTVKIFKLAAQKANSFFKGIKNSWTNILSGFNHNDKIKGNNDMNSVSEKENMSNLRKEIKEIKQEIKKVENEELNIEKVK